MSQKNVNILSGVALVALVLSMVPQLSAYAWQLWGVSLVALIVATILWYRGRPTE